MNPIRYVSALVLGLVVSACSAPTPPPVAGSGSGVSQPGSGSGAPAEGSDGSGVAAPEEGSVPLPDDAVAAVNGRAVMTAPELEAEIQRAVTNYQRLADRPPINERWRNHRRRQVVLNAVHERVIEDFVRAQGIVVTDAEVEAFVRAEVPHFDDERLFNRLIESRGLTREEFMEQERLKLMEERALAARGALEPTEEEIQEHYTANTERWAAEDRVLVSNITVRVRRNAPEDQVTAARERIEAIRSRLAAGEDFATIAGTESESADRVRGGDMGWIERGSRQSLAESGVETVLFRAPVGEVTDAIRTNLGFQIFLIRDRREAGIRAIDEVRDSIAGMLRRQRRQTLRSTLVRELLPTSNVQYFEDQWGLEVETEGSGMAAPVEGSVAPE